MAGRLPVLTGYAPFDLGLDVQRRFALGDATGVAGLDQGPDLVADRTLVRALRFVVERDRRATDVVISAAAEEQGGDAHEPADDDDGHDHDRQRILHFSSL